MPEIDCLAAAKALRHHPSDELLHKVVICLQWLFQYMRPIGVILLVIAVAYLALAAWHQGSVKLLRWTLPVPPFKLTVYQMVVAVADLLVAAWVLYLLMPHMTGIDYPKFVAIYMVAYVIVVITHVPGGLGVLELVVLLLVPCQYGSQGFAALIVFRIIYFWAPLVLAAVLLVGYEVILRKQSPPPTADGGPHGGGAREPMSDLFVAQPEQPYHCWPHRLAWLLVLATFPLLLVGATVTGYGAGMSVPDWPTTYGYWFYPLHLWIRVWDLFLEHGHRTLAQLVGAITVVLAVLVWRLDSRRAVHWLALAAVIGVILQGTIGGLRVIADERLLARLHGCTAPLLFTLFAALVSVTSRRWLTAPAAGESAAAGRLHRLLWAITAAIYVEIVVGTPVASAFVRRRRQLVRLAGLDEGHRRRVDRRRAGVAVVQGGRRGKR